MGLDRSAITGQAFTTSIDGYDRQQVDRHLEAIAQALEEAQSPAVGARASEKLREILEGAERSAEALRGAAAQEAQSVSESARQEAEALRVKTDEETASQLVSARAAVKGLLERVEALHLGIEHTQERIREAGEEMARRLAADAAPVERALRERAEALGAELDLMGSGLSSGTVARVMEQRATVPEDATGLSDQDLETAAGSLGAPTPIQTTVLADAEGPSSDADLLALGRRELKAERPDAQPAETGARPERAVPAESYEGDGAPAPTTAPLPAPATPAPTPATTPATTAPDQTRTAPDQATTASAQPGRSRPGEERARLVALNMALAGASREETEKHLRAEFGLEEPGSILREVYARTEGME